MERFDTVVRGGLIATAEAWSRAEIGIRDGRIGAIAERLQGERLIDVSGCIVMPGAIDVHTHFDTSLGTAVTADDYESGSRAAAFGGITCFINYAFQEDGQPLRAAIERESRKAEGKSYLDYSFHPVVTHVDESVLAELRPLCEDGFTSVKVFIAVPGFQLRDEDLLGVLAAAAKSRVLVNVHAEDGALIEHLTARLRAAGITSVGALPKARPPVAEALATEKIGFYAGETGCAVYVVHLSSRGALEGARRARLRGVELYIETRPAYLFLDDGRYLLPENEGRKYVSWPPLRSKDDQEALWSALASGEIDTYATDHTTWMLAEKTNPSLDFGDVPGGVSNVESCIGMLYSEGVRRGRMSLSRFVAATSTNPAKLFGLWPRKGTISVGADADLTVIDPELRFTIVSKKMQSRSDFDPYEGYEATGWPVMTIAGGSVVVEDGELKGERGRGRLISRAPYESPDRTDS